MDLFLFLSWALLRFLNLRIYVFYKLWKISILYFIGNRHPFSVPFFLKCMRERENAQMKEMNLCIPLPCFISCTSFPSKHKSSAKKFRKPALPHTSASVYLLSILVCIHCSGFQLDPWRFLIYSCNLSYAFRTIFFICYIRNLGYFFSGNIFKLSSL